MLKADGAMTVLGFVYGSLEDRVADGRLALDRGDFDCGAVKTARTDPERIMGVIERLKSSGRLDKILAKYR